ncbi:MAG: hypothetical protein [Microvirus sp.]|nr:MAG: hypothetical protein [Microvirus sp.]
MILPDQIDQTLIERVTSAVIAAVLLIWNLIIRKGIKK